MRGSRLIEGSNTQSLKKHILCLSLHSFPIFHFSFLVGAAWTVDRRRRSSRVARPARAAHSRCTPRRGPSRACGVSGLKRPRRRVLHIALPARLLRRCVLRIALSSGGTRSRCGHSQGAGRPQSRLDPTSSDLAPYRCGDLIKR